jgi:hypothetical protein
MFLSSPQKKRLGSLKSDYDKFINEDSKWNLLAQPKKRVVNANWNQTSALTNHKQTKVVKHTKTLTWKGAITSFPNILCDWQW